MAVYFVYACNTCGKANIFRKKLSRVEAEIKECVYCENAGVEFVREDTEN